MRHKDIKRISELKNGITPRWLMVPRLFHCFLRPSFECMNISLNFNEFRGWGLLTTHIQDSYISKTDKE